MNKQSIFTSRLEIRSIDKEKFTITHIINTKVLDRHGTVILPIGVKVDNYLKNPVVLAIHNGNTIPIGRCIDLKVTDENIETTTLFNTNDPIAMQFFKAYEDGFMNAWSIGFMPLKWTAFDEENYQDINQKYGLNITLDQIKDAGFWGIYLIYEWELLEYSAVPVPANPEALNILVEKGFSVVEEEQSEKDFRETLKQIDEINKETQERKVIGYKQYPLAAEDTTWDGSAEKAKAEVKDLKEMCTWYDAEKSDNKGAYKLPHHKAEEYLTVWNGVKAAMGALLGARGGVDIAESDRKGVYNHLSKHYKEFEKEVPEFKTMEQLQKEEFEEVFRIYEERIVKVETLISEVTKVLDQVVVLEETVKNLQLSIDKKSDKTEITGLLQTIEEEIKTINKAIEEDNVDTIRKIAKGDNPDKNSSGSWVKNLANKNNLI